VPKLAWGQEAAEGIIFSKDGGFWVNIEKYERNFCKGVKNR